jgi:hypothetical protein
MPDETKNPPSDSESKESGAPPADKKKHDTLAGKRSSGMSAVAQEAERLQSAATSKPAADMTDRLSAADRAALPGFAGLAFGADPGAARFYRKLPLSLGTADLPQDTPRWRIELEGLGPGVEPLGLDILGDAVLGRGRVGSQPVDLDMDLYGGLEQGVSRRHALLRPTANHLYIIDLGSTNGTMHNGLPLGPGITRSLKHNDSITLGRLSFNIKIIDGPGYHKPAPPPAVEADGEPTRPLTKDDAGVASLAAETQSRFPKITQEMIDARRKELETEQKDGGAADQPAAKAEPKPAEKPIEVPDSKNVETGKVSREALFPRLEEAKKEDKPAEKPKEDPAKSN